MSRLCLAWDMSTTDSGTRSASVTLYSNYIIKMYKTREIHSHHIARKCIFYLECSQIVIPCTRVRGPRAHALSCLISRVFSICSWRNQGNVRFVGQDCLLTGPPMLLKSSLSMLIKRLRKGSVLHWSSYFIIRHNNFPIKYLRRVEVRSNQWKNKYITI